MPTPRTHGGKREGAGRKPGPGPTRQVLSFRLLPEIAQRLRAIATQRGISPSSVLEGLIMEAPALGLLIDVPR